MTEELASKRYEPDTIDMDHNDSRSLTIKLVGYNKKVLEVGTSTGYVTRILKERGNRVTGIEIDAEAGKIAAQYCESMIIGDVEGISLEDTIEESSLDVIVFADVLEHLKEPGRVLEKVKKFLKPGGYLVISLPNECHGDVVLSLLNGDFQYTPMGLHDATHLRFFGLKNIFNMLNERGYTVTNVNRVRVPVGYTELRIGPDQVPDGLLNFIKSIPDSDVYQYVFTAAYAGDSVSLFDPIPARELKPLFSTAFEAAVENRAEQLNYELLASNSKTLSQMEVLRRRILENEHELGKKDAKIDQLENIIFSHKEVIVNKDAHIHNLENIIKEDNKKITDIQSSITWKTLTKFQSFINFLLPPSTGRGHAYGMGLKGIRIIANEGPISFLKKLKRSNSKSDNSTVIKTKQATSRVVIPMENEAPIDKSISIVIPTKNAGPDFEFTLEKIKNQKGVKKAEIVIIDSGSTDGTQALAEKYGAGFYSIKPEEYNHGSTRNIGAEKVSGDYVLFMVQDAIPAGDRWLYCMAKALNSDAKIAAVTCRQLPRCDSDLFACFSLWNHYRALDFANDKITCLDGKLNDLSPLEKRKLAGIEDTCCLIRKDVFDQLKYKDLQYAEDLDLGLRLIGQKYKIAFLYSVGVIHSHNRSPIYFIKRAYVDNKLLPGILSYHPQPSNGRDANESLGSVLALYAALNATLSTLDPALFDGKIEHLFAAMKSSIGNNLKAGPGELKRYVKGNTPLDKIFDELKTATGEDISLKPDDLIDRHYINLVDDFQCYLKNYGSLNGKMPELAESLYKLFSIAAGATLADYYLNALDHGGNNVELAQLDKILSAGI